MASDGEAVPRPAAFISMTRNRMRWKSLTGVAARRWLLAGCGVAATAVGAEPGAAQMGAPPPSPAYQAVAGDDWRAYRSVDDLRAAGRFWWFRDEDVYRWVELVPDPRWGQVARIVFAASPEPGFAPRITVRLPAPLERMWFRWRMRWSPGWTTAGPNPPGHANSYKVAFWLWEGFDGRGQVEISNTDEYVLGVGARRDGQPVRWRERALPGSGGLGRVTTEWTDGQWWEFVALYERMGPQRARQHWWRRRLSPVPGAWSYAGVELEGAPVPRVRAVELGANRNKSTPRRMHIDWGPWEVVDGTRYANPFGMPGFESFGTARTLSDERSSSTSPRFFGGGASLSERRGRSRGGRPGLQRLDFLFRKAPLRHCLYAGLWRRPKDLAGRTVGLAACRESSPRATERRSFGRAPPVVQSAGFARALPHSAS